MTSRNMPFTWTSSMGLWIPLSAGSSPFSKSVPGVRIDASFTPWRASQHWLPDLERCVGRCNFRFLYNIYYR